MWLENNWKKSSIIAESSIMLKAILLKFSLEIPSLVYICWCQLIGTNLGPNHKNGHSSAIIASNPKLFGVWNTHGPRVPKMPNSHISVTDPFPTTGHPRQKPPLKYHSSEHFLSFIDKMSHSNFFAKLWRHWKKLTICFPFFPLYIHFGAFCLAASFFVLNPL